METYKAGQGSLARLSTWLIVLLAIILGCVELYSWIYSKNDGPLYDLEVFWSLPLLGVPLSWKFLLCAGIGVGLIWLVRLYLLKPSTVDTLIETEMELKKVSWPTKDESMNATWVVVLVTLLLTVTLSVFDGILRAVFDMVF